MEYKLIGKIAGFKGLKGKLKIKSFSGFIEKRLQANSKIYLEIDGVYQVFFVETYKVQHKNHLLTLKGYNDINKMQHLYKKEIYVDADEDIRLDDDEYHEEELIGLDVFQNKELKGKVIDIRNYPRDDYLVVETDKGHILIPFRDEFILEMTDKKIVIIEMEGLF